MISRFLKPYTVHKAKLAEGLAPECLALCLYRVYLNGEWGQEGNTDLSNYI